MKRFGWTLLLTAVLVCLLWTGAGASGELPVQLTLDVTAEAVIEMSGTWAEFTYTPDETGYYTWMSMGIIDTYGAVEDSHGNRLAEDDNGGTGNNFRVVCYLNAGTTYNLCARYARAYNIGSFDVKLEKSQGLLTASAVQSDLPVLPDTSFTLEVEATSLDEHVYYQWYVVEERDQGNTGGYAYQYGYEISGETSSSMTVASISKRSQYRCRVYDDYGTEIVVEFWARIDNQLTAQPDCETNITVPGNGTTVLKVNAGCSNGSLWYQWRKERNVNGYWRWELNSILCGENSDTLTTDPVTEYTMYVCEITDDYLNTTEVTFMVNCDESSYFDNQLSAQPVGSDNVTIRYNDTADLEVTASCSNGSLAYQWFRQVEHGNYPQWEAVSGATSSVFTTDPAHAPTRYCCQVTDDYSNRDIVFFYIHLENVLNIIRFGDSTVAVPLNATTTFEVNATCLSGGTRFQWYRPDPKGVHWPGNAISGATGNTFTTFPVVEETRYICMAFDDYGHYCFTEFYVTIDNQLTATAVGDTWLGVAPNSTVDLEVDASCANGSLTYRWYKNIYHGDNATAGEVLIPGAEGNTVTTDPVTAPAQYRCDVSDEYGGEKSVYFYVDMDNQLTVRPVGNSSRKVSLNDTVSLTVNASCLVGGLRYQWYRSMRDANGNWSDQETLEGAVSDTITTDPINTLTEYFVEVTDDYGRTDYQSFRLSVDNGLVVQRKHRVYTIAPGSSVTLEIEATCNTGSLTYNWWIEGYNEPTRTIEDITERSWYTCEVGDIYGNFEYCEFEVNFETDLWVEAVGNTEITVPYGSDVTLEVAFGCTQSEEVGIDWSAFGWDHFSEKTESEDLTKCTLTNVTGLVGVYAQVYDSFGNYRQAEFTIRVENAFSAVPVGSTVRTVQAGEEVTLEVQAAAMEGGFRYEWYEGDRGLENDRASITITVTESAVYRCYVYDMYETSEIIIFTLNVGAPQTIAVGQSVTVRIDTPKKYSIFAFTPAATGTYTLYSFGSTDADPYAKLYDGNGQLLDESDDMYSYSYNDSDAHCRLTARLTAGQTCQYWVSSYDTGSFTIRLIRESSGTGNGMEAKITLRAGQSVILPPLYGEIASVTSDDTATVSVSGNALTALRTGTATVTAEGASGTAVYDVTVVVEAVLNTPAGLRVIEQNAFSGDRQVRFVVLGDHVSRIDAFAFSGCGLEQLVIPAVDTQIAFSALNGVRPLIVCRPGSTAEAFAREFGYVWVYIN